jgi:hypothetical protein
MKDENTNKVDKSTSASSKKKAKEKKIKCVETKPESHTNAIDDALKQKLADIINNKIEQYSDTIDIKKTTYREDFNCLQPIVSEFLDDFLIIGHSLDGQRVVIRYTATPGDLDKLTELSRRVFIRMLNQDNQQDSNS